MSAVRGPSSAEGGLETKIYTPRLLGPVAANFENDYKRKEKLYERNERLKIPNWREDDGHLCWLSAQAFAGSVGLGADCPAHRLHALSQAVSQESLSWVSGLDTITDSQH